MRRYLVCLLGMRGSSPPQPQLTLVDLIHHSPWLISSTTRKGVTVTPCRWGEAYETWLLMMAVQAGWQSTQAGGVRDASAARTQRPAVSAPAQPQTRARTQPAHLQRNQVQDGGHRALAAALPVGIQRLQLLAVSELDPAVGSGKRHWL